MWWFHEFLLCFWSPVDTYTHPLNVLVTVQSCVLCPVQASVSTTSCTTSSPCVTPTRAWTSTLTASSAAWFGLKPCSVSQSARASCNASNFCVTLATIGFCSENLLFRAVQIYFSYTLKWFIYTLFVMILFKFLQFTKFPHVMVHAMTQVRHKVKVNHSLYWGTIG